MKSFTKGSGRGLSHQMENFKHYSSKWGSLWISVLGKCKSIMQNETVFLASKFSSFLSSNILHKNGMCLFGRGEYNLSMLLNQMLRRPHSCFNVFAALFSFPSHFIASSFPKNSGDVVISTFPYVYRANFILLSILVFLRIQL